ncbi:MAG: methyltransferase domain-containing protein [Nitrospinota bacterium]
MIFTHNDMLKDRVRCESYRRAIHRRVRPGDVVLDLGCGTGLLSFFACQAGARKVYAVEEQDIVHLAREAARRNRFSERIEFLQAFSLDLSLPEKVDIILSELIGFFVFDEGVLTYLIDARERFLKPGGKLLPERVELFMVPAARQPLWREVGRWQRRAYGLDLGHLGEYLAHNILVGRLEPKGFLSRPKSLGRVDFYRVKETSFEGRARFRVEREGLLCGLGGWFELSLAPGIGLSTSPLSPRTGWGSCLFPLMSPTPVGPGERVEVDFRATPLAGEVFLSWDVSAQGGPPQRHSTFRGFPARRESLRLPRRGKARHWRAS